MTWIIAILVWFFSLDSKPVKKTWPPYKRSDKYENMMREARNETLKKHGL